MELWHYGVKGMKWGVRHYQNKDGTWTALGKSRRSEQHKNKNNPSDPSLALSIRHKEVRTFRNPGNIARTGEYWYNQNREMLADINVGEIHKRYGRYKPNTVVEYVEAGQRQINRIIHDSNGVQVQQIHSGSHKWSDKNNYGKDGVHKHIFDQNGNRLMFPDGTHGKKLSSKERKEQGDLLRRQNSRK